MRIGVNLRELGVPLCGNGDSDSDYEYVTDHYLRVIILHNTEDKEHLVGWTYKTVDEGGPGCGDYIIGQLKGMVCVPYGCTFKECAKFEDYDKHMHYGALEEQEAPDGVFCCGRFKTVHKAISAALTGLSYRLLIKQLDDLVWQYYWPRGFREF